jgi:hypothetical protein
LNSITNITAEKLDDLEMFFDKISKPKVGKNVICIYTGQVVHRIIQCPNFDKIQIIFELGGASGCFEHPKI